MKNFISDADTVISTLDPSMDRKATGTPVLDGHINIIKAMENKDKSRFITLATPIVNQVKDSKYIESMPIIGS